MIARIDKVSIPELRHVARQVFGGMVKNPGGGSGAPTVVIQQGEEEGVTLQELKWDAIQGTIQKYGLGRQ
ncbi:hypothetical protein KCU67_g14469, partial [Aureobasidium melanogenum]